jgi:hypothetical protein
MVLIGSGMGQMFQTYVVAMQNSVPRSSLGIATASIQFSRTIGSMFGAAIFGAILTRRLASELTSRLGDAAQQVSPGALLSGTMRVADVPRRRQRPFEIPWRRPCTPRSWEACR